MLKKNNIRNLIVFSTLIFISCVKEEESQKKPTERPNILFIMSDDHAYQAISAYDGQDSYKHQISIALQTKEYCLVMPRVANSICAPIKSCDTHWKAYTVISMEKLTTEKPFDTTQVTFPQLFQKAGYQTAMFGKLHFGNNPKRC